MRTLSLAALLACGSRPDIQAQCDVAVGVLELCGDDCAAALDAVRVGCLAMAGGAVCSVVPTPGGATLPSAPPGVTPTPPASRTP